MKKKNDRNPKYTEISIYVIVTVIIIYILAKIADHFGDIFSFVTRGLNTIGAILTPLLAGFVIAYLLYPLVQGLRKRMAKWKFYAKRNKDPKAAAVALTYVGIVLAVIVFFSVIISVMTQEISVISGEDLVAFAETFIASMQSFYEDLLNLFEQMSMPSEQLRTLGETVTGWLSAFVSELGNSLMASISNVTGFLTNFVFAIILSLYFLLDAENLMKYWDRVLKAIAPKNGYRIIHRGISDADFVFSGYIRGQLIDAFLMALMISIALSLVGVKFAIPIGILAGIGNLIPYVGPLIAYALTIIVCLLNGDFKKLIIAVIVLFVVQTIDGNIINPKLLSSNTNVHPMLVIVALLFGSAVGGIGGMLLAVPVAALLKIWFDRFVNVLVQKRGGSGEETAIEDKEEM